MKRLGLVVGGILVLLAGVIALAVPTTSAVEGEYQISDKVLVTGPGRTSYNDVKAGDVLTGKIEVTNSFNEVKEVKVWAVPFSVAENGVYDFFTEGTLTEVSKWLSLEKEVYTVPAQGSIDVNWTITVPRNWTLGGSQTAALKFHTVGSDNTEKEVSGYVTQTTSNFAWLFLLNMDGEGVVRGGKILSWDVPMIIFDGENGITAKTTYKNDGNVNFQIKSHITMYDAFNGVLAYENDKTTMIMPETQTEITQHWDGSPAIGVFRVSEEIDVLGNTEKFEKLVLVVPLWFVIIVIGILLLLIWALVLKIREYHKRQKRLNS